MRVFLAVEIDEKLLGKIAAVQKQFSESEAPVKYVETENLHYTLKFFGEIDKKKAKDIIKVVENKIQDYKPFEVNIKKSGAFPSEKYIRVLWLGMEDIEQFSTLQKDLDTEFINMGFKKERSYIPHLTIGRVKGAGNKEELLSKLKELEDVEIGEMVINKLVLKKSDLTPLGPIYTTLKEFDLK
ncbi:MAG: RNA 2',3'-cyclic phosphodiesterase [Methanobacterium sp.]|uniref:RNA 2',3'-cyclic phosphodiesterase n=1 Tax=Methanobacterium sp. TaxID=2164 RepID=UPI003D6582BB|nr:RNA 2',3'-cyclic phosphodiesterase [Methanobacterium sp.]